MNRVMTLASVSIAALALGCPEVDAILDPEDDDVADDDATEGDDDTDSSLDADGDGGDDLIIGAQDDSQASFWAGAVFFFPGSGQ